MVHPNTQRLTEYWQDRRYGAVVPRRSDIDPMAFHDLLPQVLIVGRSAQGTFPFRLAGGFVSDLHRADLRGRCLLDLWRPTDRGQLRSALEFARRRPEPVIVAADILADGAPSVSMEVLLAPLTNADGAVDRFIGLYQPTAPVARLKGQPAKMLAVTALARTDGGEEAPSLRLAALHGRRIA
ncbi:MAG: PAS domain-containing protein [Caulobacter sp.]|nr:PAS domain-containing protein [Caulobacter sp.]